MVFWVFTHCSIHLFTIYNLSLPLLPLNAAISESSKFGCLIIWQMLHKQFHPHSWFQPPPRDCVLHTHTQISFSCPDFSLDSRLLHSTAGEARMSRWNPAFLFMFRIIVLIILKTWSAFLRLEQFSDSLLIFTLDIKVICILLLYSFRKMMPFHIRLACSEPTLYSNQLRDSNGCILHTYSYLKYFQACIISNKKKA